MCFSNEDGIFSAWEKFSQLRSWDLSADAGRKTVSFKVKDRVGKIADPVEAHICYDHSAADSTPPEITNISPEADSAVDDSRPAISASYSDAMTGDSGINVSSVKLMLDGIDVTRMSFVNSVGVHFNPNTSLDIGKHYIVLDLKDNSYNGNSVRFNWSFTVTPASFIMNIVINPPTATL
jgi:hypothetical protein